MTVTVLRNSVAAVKGNVVPLAINQLVKNLRDRHGWTQRRMADEIGITEASIRNYERGRRGKDPKKNKNVEFLIRLKKISPPDLLPQIDALLPPDLREIIGASEPLNQSEHAPTRRSMDDELALEALRTILDHASVEQKESIRVYLQKRAHDWVTLREGIEEGNVFAEPQQKALRGHQKEQRSKKSSLAEKRLLAALFKH